MATANYNEVTNSAEPSSDAGKRDPMFHWDTHFPERMSKLHLSPDHDTPVRRARKSRSRNAARFKTQPITFDEIKEVDEEPTEENKLCIMTQFAAFSRSMDGLLPQRTQSASPQPPGDCAVKREEVEEPPAAAAAAVAAPAATPATTRATIEPDAATMNAFRRRRRNRQQRSIEEEASEGAS